MREQCRAWWSSKQDALHRYRTEDWLEGNAHELLCLFPLGGTLIDVGCGDAQLLTYLAPRYDEVIGIDFSPSMLKKAAERLNAFGIKNARLELGDACQFPSSVSHADVILSNGVAQNLDPEEIAIHLQECRRVLNPAGSVGLCGIPWVNLRMPFLSGALMEPPPKNGVRRSLSVIRRRLQLQWAERQGNVMADGMGRWYGRDQIHGLATAEGFDCHMVSSWYSEYRFHARLRYPVSAAARRRSHHVCPSLSAASGFIHSST
jgi:cyclopropane-fatty-acyl-phospholipid synthase